MDEEGCSPVAEQIGARTGLKVTIHKLERTTPEGVKVRTHPRYSWRCSYVASGKRVSKYFKTRTKAEEWAEDREKEALAHGTYASLTSSERSVVIESRVALQELGVSLRDVVSIGVEHYRRAKSSCTVTQLAETVVLEKVRAGLSTRHTEDMRCKLKRFAKTFGSRSVATLTRSEIEAWLHQLKLSAASFNSYRRILVVAFNDAMRDGHIDENPAQKVRPAKVIESEVGIITPAEAAAMLAGADSQIRPAVALGLFAGLRMSELEQLDWSEIHLDFKNIQVKAAKAKSARNRLVTIPDNLAAWLRESERRTGSVWPESHQRGRKMMEAARRAAGYGSSAEVRKAESASIATKSGEAKGRKSQVEQATAQVPGVRKWPDNALRHSYATYHLAYHEKADLLALQLGHANTALIFAHYRRPVSKEEARVYWSIVPGNAKGVAKLTVVARDRPPSAAAKGSRSKR